MAPGHSEVDPLVFLLGTWHCARVGVHTRVCRCVHVLVLCAKGWYHLYCFFKFLQVGELTLPACYGSEHLCARDFPTCGHDVLRLLPGNRVSGSEDMGMFMFWGGFRTEHS